MKSQTKFSTLRRAQTDLTRYCYEREFLHCANLYSHWEQHTPTGIKLIPLVSLSRSPVYNEAWLVSQLPGFTANWTRACHVSVHDFTVSMQIMATHTQNMYTYIHTYTHSTHTSHLCTHRYTHYSLEAHTTTHTHVHTSTYICICRHMPHICTHMHTSGTDYHNLLFSSAGGGEPRWLEKLKVFLRSIVKRLPLALTSPLMQESSPVAALKIFLYLDLDCILGNNVKQLTVKALLPQQNKHYNDNNWCVDRCTEKEGKLNGHWQLLRLG